MLRAWAPMCAEVPRAAQFRVPAVSRPRKVPRVLSMMSGTVSDVGGAMSEGVRPLADSKHAVCLPLTAPGFSTQ